MLRGARPAVYTVAAVAHTSTPTLVSRVNNANLVPAVAVDLRMDSRENRGGQRSSVRWLIRRTPALNEPVAL